MLVRLKRLNGYKPAEEKLTLLPGRSPSCLMILLVFPSSHLLSSALDLDESKSQLKSNKCQLKALKVKAKSCVGIIVRNICGIFLQWMLALRHCDKNPQPMDHQLLWPLTNELPDQVHPPIQSRPILSCPTARADRPEQAEVILCG